MRPKNTPKLHGVCALLAGLKLQREVVLRPVVQERGQPQNISSDEALVRYATHRCLNRKDILDDEAFIEIDVDVVAVTHDRRSRGWRADRRLTYRLDTKPSR